MAKVLGQIFTRHQQNTQQRHNGKDAYLIPPACCSEFFFCILLLVVEMCAKIVIQRTVFGVVKDPYIIISKLRLFFNPYTVSITTATRASPSLNNKSSLIFFEFAPHSLFQSNNSAYKLLMKFFPSFLSSCVEYGITHPETLQICIMGWQ